MRLARLEGTLETHAPPSHMDDDRAVAIRGAMVDQAEEWRPGSFTKNFSWGTEKGFAQLYESIRIGFDLKLEDVPREVFRERLEHVNRPVYIPINFFLFNRPKIASVNVV